MQQVPADTHEYLPARHLPSEKTASFGKTFAPRRHVHWTVTVIVATALTFLILRCGREVGARAVFESSPRTLAWAEHKGSLLFCKQRLQEEGAQAGVRGSSDDTSEILRQPVSRVLTKLKQLTKILEVAVK